MTLQEQIAWLEKFCNDYDKMWNAGCEDVMVEKLKKFCAEEKLPYISADELLQKLLNSRVGRVYFFDGCLQVCIEDNGDRGFFKAMISLPILPVTLALFSEIEQYEVKNDKKGA